MFRLFILSLPLIGFALGRLGNKDILVSYVTASLFIFYFFARKDNARIFMPKETKYLLYFTLYLLFATLYRSAAEILTAKNISAFLTVVIYFVFYFLLTNVFILMSKKKLMGLTDLFLLICALSSLLTCFQAVMPPSSIAFTLFRNSWSSFSIWDPSLSSYHDSWAGLNRVTGFAPEPGMWAAFLAVPLGLLLPRLYYKFRVKDLFFFLSILLGFLLTYGRTGWLGLGYAIIAFPVFFFTGAKRILYLLFVAVFICITLYAAIFSNVTIKKGMDWSAYERGAGMIIAVNMFANNPLFGIGIGDFRARSFDYRFLNLSPGGGGGAFPYNMYLSLASETGIIGLFLWLLFLKALWNKLRDTLARLKTNSDEKIFVMSLTMAFLTILFGWINLGTFNEMYLFFIFALISVQARAANDAATVPTGEKGEGIV